MSRPRRSTQTANDVHSAIAEHDNISLKKLLEQGASPSTERKGKRALDTALIVHNTEAVQLLLAAGADVNWVDPVTNRVTWHYAIEHDDVDLVRCLLVAGADCSLPCVWFEVRERHRTEERTTGVLFAAIKSGAARVARLLVEHVGVALLNGANVGSQNTSPLGAAAWRHDLDLMRFLLAHGAAPHVVCRDPPAAIAIVKDDLSMLTLLIDAGVDIDAQCADGKTLLMTAIDRRRNEMARWLLDNGASVEFSRVAPMRNKSVHASIVLELTPLGVALSRRNDELLDLLLRRGASPLTVAAVEFDGEKRILLSPLQLTVNRYYSRGIAALLVSEQCEPISKEIWDELLEHHWRRETRLSCFAIHDTSAFATAVARHAHGQQTALDLIALCNGSSVDAVDDVHRERLREAHASLVLASQTLVDAFWRGIGWRRFVDQCVGLASLSWPVLITLIVFEHTYCYASMNPRLDVVKWSIAKLVKDQASRVRNKRLGRVV